MDIVEVEVQTNRSGHRFIEWKNKESIFRRFVSEFDYRHYILIDKEGNEVTFDE